MWRKIFIFVPFYSDFKAPMRIRILGVTCIAGTCGSRSKSTGKTYNLSLSYSLEGSPALAVIRPHYLLIVLTLIHMAGGPLAPHCYRVKTLKKCLSVKNL